MIGMAPGTGRASQQHLERGPEVLGEGELSEGGRKPKKTSGLLGEPSGGVERELSEGGAARRHADVGDAWAALIASRTLRPPAPIPIPSSTPSPPSPTPPTPPSSPPPPPPGLHPTSTINGRWPPSLIAAGAISIFAIVAISSTSTAAVFTTLLLQLCKVSIRAAPSA